MLIGRDWVSFEMANLMMLIGAIGIYLTAMYLLIFHDKG